MKRLAVNSIEATDNAEEVVKMKKMSVLMFVSVLFLGCTTMGHRIDQASIEKIKKGQTTKKEVLQWMGSPYQVSNDGNGNTTFFYMYSNYAPKPQTFIPILGALVGGSNMENQSVMVFFGTDGVVKDITSSTGSTEVGMGLLNSGK